MPRISLITRGLRQALLADQELFRQTLFFNRSLSQITAEDFPLSADPHATANRGGK